MPKRSVTLDDDLDQQLEAARVLHEYSSVAEFIRYAIKLAVNTDPDRSVVMKYGWCEIYYHKGSSKWAARYTNRSPYYHKWIGVCDHKIQAIEMAIAFDQAAENAHQIYANGNLPTD